MTAAVPVALLLLSPRGTLLTKAQPEEIADEANRKDGQRVYNNVGQQRMYYTYHSPVSSFVRVKRRVGKQYFGNILRARDMA